MMCCRKFNLLVGGGDEEVLPVVVLTLVFDLAVVANDPVALLLAEGRVGKDDVVAPAARTEQRILRFDDGIDAGDAVQIEVHGGEAHPLRVRYRPGELVLQGLIGRLVLRPRVLLHVLPGGEQEAGSAAGGIVDRLVRLGIDHLNHSPR